MVVGSTKRKKFRNKKMLKMSLCNICDIQKKFGPIFACFYPFFHVKLRAQVQDLQKREFYDLPEHGTATTKARCGLGTVQTSWARHAIKIMAVDSCGYSMDSFENISTKCV